MQFSSSEELFKFNQFLILDLDVTIILLYLKLLAVHNTIWTPHQYTELQCFDLTGIFSKW